MSTKVYPFQNVGALVDSLPISVTDAGATSHTMTPGTRGIIYQNTGGAACWMGGSSIVPISKRGFNIKPTDAVHFEKPLPDHKAYFKCTAGDSTTISVIEY